jgi:predicted nucleic acid-binding protein
LREFFDTSVLIAAFWGGHANHEASIKQFAAADKKHSGCAAHTLAEVYATMTALPVRPLIPPEQALLFVEEVRKRLSLVSLEPEEYYETIQRAADRGLTSGHVYDALLMSCAAKSKAEIIYTWTSSTFIPSRPNWLLLYGPRRKGRTLCKSKVQRVRHPMQSLPHPP